MIKNKAILVLIFFVGIVNSCGQKSLNRKYSSKEEINLDSSKESGLKVTSEKEKTEVLWGEFDSRLAAMVKKVSGSEEDKEFLASDLYLKATDASKLGDFKTSTTILKHILSIYPEDKFLKRKYAYDLLKIKKYDEAQGLLESLWLSSKKKDEKTGFLLGGLYFAKENFKKAKQTYSKVLKINPENVEACVMLSSIHHRDENLKKAISSLSKCEKSNREEPLYQYYSGKFYLEKGNYKKAIISFQRALKKSPNLFQAALGIGLIYEEQGKVKKAIKAYQEFLKAEAGQKVILSRLINLMFAESNFQGIIPYLERMITIDPEDLNMRVKLGILYSDSKKFEKAITIFKNLLKEVPDSDKLHYYLASIYQEKGELMEALEAYQKVDVESSLYPESAIQAADILKNLTIVNSEYENQYLDYVSKLEFKSNSEKVRLAIIQANYYESKNDVSKAVSYLEQVEKFEEFGENQKYYFSLLLDKSDQFEKAEKIVMEMLEKNPENTDALNFLGYSYVEKEIKMDTAYKYLTKAASLLPENGYIRDSLGWYYYKVGNYNKALREFEKASSNVENDGVILKHLAMAYEKLGNKKLAKKYFELSLQNLKDEKEIAFVQNLLEEIASVRIPASKE